MWMTLVEMIKLKVLQSEFKMVPQGIQTLPDLKLRYDETPQVQTCSEMDSDQLNLKHPIPTFP